MRIEICGGIASGKTTLTKILEQHGYCAVYERFEDNPFLKDFYQSNNYNNAFETEMVFTLLHHHQLMASTGEGITVSDYSLLQDYCYSVGNLTEDEFHVYKGVYGFLTSQMHPADLTIFLKCSVECLLERIKKRNREAELFIDRNYLQKNIDILEDYVCRLEHVLVIDSERMNFIKSDQSKVLQMIKNALEQYEDR